MPTTAVHLRLTIPVLDPTDDPVSFAWAYAYTGTDVNTDAPAFVAQVTNFFNTAATGASSPIGEYLGPQCDRAAGHCQWDLYDISTALAGTPAGGPIAMGSWTLSANFVGAALPSGDAAVISYRADYGSDVEFGPHTRPRARDRNRTYIGPLGQLVTQTDPTTGRCKFSAQFITDCLAAFNQYVALASPFGLQIWSRKNAALKLPIEAWMDDRPDYQRRRSDPSTVRQTHALTAVE